MEDLLASQAGIRPTHEWIDACRTHLRQNSERDNEDEVLHQIIHTDLRNVVRCLNGNTNVGLDIPMRPSLVLRRAISQSSSAHNNNNNNNGNGNGNGNGNNGTATSICKAVLPPNFRCMVQIEELLDVSLNAEDRLAVGPASTSAPSPIGNQRKRCLKMLLSDGYFADGSDWNSSNSNSNSNSITGTSTSTPMTMHNNFVAMETKPIPNLSVHSKPGIKIILSGPIHIYLGILMLDPSNTTVVGGCIPSLIPIQKKAMECAAKLAGVGIGIDATYRALVYNSERGMEGEEEEDVDEADRESGDVSNLPRQHQQHQQQQHQQQQHQQQQHQQPRNEARQEDSDMNSARNFNYNHNHGRGRSNATTNRERTTNSTNTSTNTITALTSSAATSTSSSHSLHSSHNNNNNNTYLNPYLSNNQSQHQHQHQNRSNDNNNSNTTNGSGSAMSTNSNGVVRNIYSKNTSTSSTSTHSVQYATTPNTTTTTPNTSARILTTAACRTSSTNNSSLLSSMQSQSQPINTTNPPSNNSNKKTRSTSGDRDCDCVGVSVGASAALGVVNVYSKNKGSTSISTSASTNSNSRSRPQQESSSSDSVVTTDNNMNVPLSLSPLSSQPQESDTTAATNPAAPVSSLNAQERNDEINKSSTTTTTTAAAPPATTNILQSTKVKTKTKALTKIITTSSGPLSPTATSEPVSFSELKSRLQNLLNDAESYEDHSQTTFVVPCKLYSKQHAMHLGLEKNKDYKKKSKSKKIDKYVYVMNIQITGPNEKDGSITCKLSNDFIRPYLTKGAGEVRKLFYEDKAEASKIINECGAQITGDLRTLAQCELKLLYSTDDFFSSADSAPFKNMSRTINGEVPILHLCSRKSC